MPTVVLAVIIYVSFSLANMYGIACAALGMLGTLASGVPLRILWLPICEHADIWGCQQVFVLPTAMTQFFVPFCN